MKIKTRFAPSPTGYLHLGNIRTALFSWLFAKRYKGKFVLRIEDTDYSRSSKTYSKNILTMLNWLNLQWDEGPYYQSKNIEYYQKIIKNMVDNNTAYKCYCTKNLLLYKKKQQILKKKTPRYDRTCRYLKQKTIIDSPYTIRFRNPLKGKVTFYDEIKGKLEFNNEELDDLIIQRSDGIPTYNFCVVIDDTDIDITHIIRGEEHINNTPRQINILKSMDFKIPKYAHLPMIIDETGKKLSKRNNNFSISEYYDQGFLPEAILNYIVRLGWSHGNKEIFSLTEMKNLFSLKSVNKSSSTFQLKKLIWMNKYYINHVPEKSLRKLYKYYLKKENLDTNIDININKIIVLLRSRCNTIKEIATSSKYFFQEISLKNIIIFKKYKTEKHKKFLKKIKDLFFYIPEWTSKLIEITIKNFLIQFHYSLKDMYTLLRVILTGNEISPSISIIMEILGKKKVILRIENAILYIEKFI